MRADDPAATCPVCSYRVPPDAAAAADEIAVAYDPRRDEIAVVGALSGYLHTCPAASLPRDAAGHPIRPA